LHARTSLNYIYHNEQQHKHRHPDGTFRTVRLHQGYPTPYPVDKSKEAAVEKSTLISLLIYHHVDTQYPEYFRYVSRSLEKFKKTAVTQEEFLKIFMNPEIDMAMADKN
jgi:hypothetical protein